METRKVIMECDACDCHARIEIDVSDVPAQYIADCITGTGWARVKPYCLCPKHANDDSAIDDLIDKEIARDEMVLDEELRARE